MSVPLCWVKSRQNFILPLKKLKVEGNKVRFLGQVQGTILKFFNLESWQEAVTKCGDSVGPDRLLGFEVKL